ncbi:MAG: thiolase family protein [Candidatus Helarchaeota archaeon]|nr:thiolase family protein [Candidatus Helarchaeota archaeon]
MTERKNVVVVSAKRTPMGKSSWNPAAKPGIFYWANAQEFGGQIFRNIWEDAKKKAPDLKPEDLEAIAYGCSGQYGSQSGDIARLSAVVQKETDFYPVFGVTCDSYCNSGTSAIQYINNMLALGQGEVGVAGGQELLSLFPLGSSMMAHIQDKKTGKPTHKRVLEMHKLFMKRTLGLGPAGEKIAWMWNLKREDLDEFAARSHRNMIKVQRQKDKYEPRIMPMTIPICNEKGKPIKEPETRKIKTITHTVDETPRAVYLDNPEKAMEKMKSLKPRFSDGEHSPPKYIHAGNASAISDGGAAMLLMTEEKASQLGVKPLARIVDISNSASDPKVVLTGPIPATKKILKRNGLKFDDFDLIHINEAFASVPFVTMHELGSNALTDERLNTSGGAIAGGHPIGASGVAWAVELVWEMVHNKKKLGLFTLCAGFGNGMSVLFENMQI